MAGHRKRARKHCGRKRSHAQKPASQKPASKRARPALTAAERRRRRRKRYAQDPQFREKLLAFGRAYYAANKDEILARRRRRCAEDPDYRDRPAATKRRSARKCRTARNKRQRERYANDANFRERYRAARRGEPARRRWLMRAYGITPEQYDAMLKRQKGRCAICREKPRYRLRIDHDHITKVVRRLLCIPCNLGLGCFKDRPALLRRAAKYLERTGRRGRSSRGEADACPWRSAA
jgi:Recombination endonuclease VII